MEEEIMDEYVIPANYTDSGKIFGGLLSPRNAIETLILVVGMGYLEYMLFSAAGIFRIIFMCVTLIPLAVVALMGIDGDSLFQYLGHIVGFIKHRRKLHFKMGVEDVQTKIEKK